MKITVKLAYSQLKINRSRTIWTLLAIVLSTALTTAVCNFVNSGNTMLVELLGENYGLYGKMYFVLLLIPAVILGSIIIAMSVTVISNVFRISAQERVTQFGIMKCTGATKKQITDIVIYESVLLCIIGIPVGITAGVLLAFGGMQIANHFLDDLNALAHIMINEINLSLHFVFSWQALLISAIRCFLTVLYSAWLPAHKAARVPAIDCIRGAGEIRLSRNQVRTSPLVNKFFGFEGTLAAKNIRRSRRNIRATMISLSVGVILFIGLGGLGSQAAALEDYMTPAAPHTVVSEYLTAYTTSINADTGMQETIYTNPIDSELGNIVTKKLEEFEDTEIFGLGNDNNTYHAVLPKEIFSAQMLEALEKEGQPIDELPVEIITLDHENYESLCSRANLPPDSVILLNYYLYNDFGREVKLTPYSSEIKEAKLTRADGSSITVPIQGILTQEDMPAELFYPNTKPFRLIVPEAQLRDYSWYCSPEDIDGFMAYSNSVLQEFFPSNADSSYMENGFDTRVFKMNDYMKVMNIAIALAAVFMYSFTALLMLIGLANVISTLSTNVLMRSREFAVLKSVGMTSESLRRMLKFESIFYSLRALLYGLPVGIALTYLINLPIRMMLPIPYELPWLSIVLCIIIVFLITWNITRYAAHKLKNQNLIETIRAESGR